MTETRAGTGIRVADVARAVAFYADGLRFPVVLRDPAADIAIVDGAGFFVLLAGPRAGDARAWLLESASFAPPETTVYVSGGSAGDLDGLLAGLAARGIEARIVVTSSGDHSLLTTDLDGYTVRFWTPTTLPPAEVLARYVAGPDELDAALAGLPSGALDLRLRPEHAGHWSIRQITHHLADGEALSLGRIILGVANPGRPYQPNGYDPASGAVALAYDQRAIEPALTLFRASRAYAVEIMQRIPDASDRSTRTPDGGELTTGALIAMLMSHACEHIEDIYAIRERHGV